MTKKNPAVPDFLRFTGGFDDFTDRELAEWELRETQLKLSGRWTPPNERGDDRETATIKLNATLSGGKTVKQQQAAPVVTMKFDQAPMKASSKKEAERQLRRTQTMLAHARVKQNAAPAKTTPSISNFPVKDNNNVRPQDLDAIHKNAIERLVNNAPDAGISVDELARSLGIDPERVRMLCRQLHSEDRIDI